MTFRCYSTINYKTATKSAEYTMKRNSKTKKILNFVASPRLLPIRRWKLSPHSAHFWTHRIGSYILQSSRPLELQPQNVMH